ncbi:hypothetical protein BRW65_29280 [Mycobacterium paraffinicum]|uniref:Uncharacterized protein n=1 Tax=Mycobacterium paraffinicum TaxID=53378 RepID=A0A1Q4H9M8_9MYCO|nr:hypothetical protein BRW65_29280 [Mycobacterium paraffinicum]
MDRDVAGDLEALLTAGQSTAQVEIVDIGYVEGRNLCQCYGNHLRGEVVRSHIDQRALSGPTDRETGGGDDHGFGHSAPTLVAHGAGSSE